MNNAQTKLNLMKSWGAKRLAQACPYKPKFLPAYRGPQLSQRFNIYGATMPKSAPHPAADFTWALAQLTDVREYVAAWDDAHQYVPINQFAEPLRMAA